MMEVSMKNLLLQMESKSMRDSCMRFCNGEHGGGREKGKEKETVRGEENNSELKCLESKKKKSKTGQ